MAVARVTSHTSTPTTTGAATTQTIPSVVGSGGNLVIAIFPWRDTGGETMTGATYDGNAMTHVTGAQSLGGACIDAWYYINPAGTGSIVGTWNNPPQRIHGHAHVFSGADVSGTPIGTVGVENNTGGNATVDQTLTTILDGLVIDGLYVRNDDNYAADAGQSEHTRTTVAATDGFECSTEVAVGTSTTVGWTWTTVSGFVHLAIPINPSAGGGGGSVHWMPAYQMSARPKGSVVDSGMTPAGG